MARKRERAGVTSGVDRGKRIARRVTRFPGPSNCTMSFISVHAFTGLALVSGAILLKLKN